MVAMNSSQVQGIADNISSAILSRFFPSGFRNSDIRNQINDSEQISDALKSISLTSIRITEAIQTFSNLVTSNKQLFGGQNLSDVAEDVSPRINKLSDMIDDYVKRMLSKSIIALTGERNKDGSLVSSLALGGLYVGGMTAMPLIMAPDTDDTGNQGGLATENIEPATNIDTSSITSEIPTEGKAILAAISAVESSDAYNVINYEAVARGAPKYFTDYSRHPFEGQKGFTAAGRYQILASNYEKYSPEAGVSDFTPASQDKVAWVFAQDVYSRLTRRDLSEDVRNPEMHPVIVETLAPTWHGFGDNPRKAIAVLKGAISEGDESHAPPQTVIYPQTTTQMVARTPYQSPTNFSMQMPTPSVQAYNMESPKRAAKIQQMSSRTVILPIIVNN